MSVVKIFACLGLEQNCTFFKGLVFAIAAKRWLGDVLFSRYVSGKERYGSICVHLWLSCISKKTLWNMKYGICYLLLLLTPIQIIPEK
jgi:hypothetical protein